MWEKKKTIFNKSRKKKDKACGSERLPIYNQTPHLQSEVNLQKLRWGWDTAHLIKQLLYKLKDPSLDPQHPGNSQAQCVFNPDNG